jgi:acetyl-CoA C-acetyltransferase
MSVEQLCAMPPVAGQLSVFDCAGVADGAAAAIVVRAEDAERYTPNPLYIKALSFVAGNGSGLTDPSYDYTTFPEIVVCAGRHHAQAGHRSARARDGGSARLLHADRARVDGGSRLLRARTVEEVLAGAFALDGDLPVNPDGGLKSFGHPVGVGHSDDVRSVAAVAR